jgi:hypothetical protein
MRYTSREMLLTEEAEFTIWLTGTHDEAFGLVKTSDPEHMHIIQSGPGQGEPGAVAVPTRHSA